VTTDRCLAQSHPRDLRDVSSAPVELPFFRAAATLCSKSARHRACLLFGVIWPLPPPAWSERSHPSSACRRGHYFLHLPAWLWSGEHDSPCSLRSGPGARGVSITGYILMTFGFIADSARFGTGLWTGWGTTVVRLTQNPRAPRREGSEQYTIGPAPLLVQAVLGFRVQITGELWAGALAQLHGRMQGPRPGELGWAVAGADVLHLVAAQPHRSGYAGPLWRAEGGRRESSQGRAFGANCQHARLFWHLLSVRSLARSGS